MDHPQLSIEKPKSSILKIICSNANIVIIVLYECWFIIDIIVIIVSAGEYLQIYFTSVYEVCSKSNLNMEIKQKQLKFESHLFFLTFLGIAACDVKTLFPLLISLPEGGGNALFGDSSHYPLPVNLEGLLGQCEASQLFRHHQEQGEVC